MRARITLVCGSICIVGVLLARFGRQEVVPVPVRAQMQSQGAQAVLEQASARTPPVLVEEPDLILAPKLELQTGALVWEQRISKITEASALSNGAKARELLRMLTSLPEEGLESATREAVQRLPDKDYAAAFAAVIDPQTHGMVLSVLFADLLERPDAITLPALLAIARISNHPYAPAARENLELLLGKNFGTDWLKWDAEIRRVRN